jgi:hypothetical protein
LTIEPNWLRSRKPALPAPTSSAAMDAGALEQEQRRSQALEVADRLPFGELQDDPLRRHAVVAEDGKEDARVELRRLQAPRRHVE